MNIFRSQRFLHIPLNLVNVFSTVCSGPYGTVGTNRTDCNPSDLVNTNQWVCALTHRFVRITDKSAVDCGSFVIVLLTDLLIKC